MVQGRNIHMPEGTRRDQFLAWIDALPDKQSPDWLGLPTNAETVLLTNLGKATIIKLLKMQQLDEVIFYFFFLKYFVRVFNCIVL